MQQQHAWEAALALVLLFLGLSAWFLSGSLPSGQGPIGPAFFPRILAGILILGSTTHLFSLWQQGGLLLGRAREARLRAFWRVGALWGALWLAPWLLPKLGLVPTAVLYGMLSAALLRGRWSEVLLLGLVLAVLLYLIFAELLKVS